MLHDQSADEDFVRRLPLPLAQLYRRSHNAKTPLERHLTAYYLWEASLKLLASAAVVEYADLGDHDAELAERLTNLARPSLGHWWEFARRLVPVLADKGSAPFQKLRDSLLGRTINDLPRTAGLDAALREALEGKGGARSTVRLSELTDRLVQYRNRELGHGATGRRPGDFYERMGRALLAGVSELLGRLDVLAGQRLVYLADVRRQSSGAWLIERFELTGESARRIESLEIADADAGQLPRPGQIYLAAPSGARLVALHPLLVYDAEAGEVLFLNSRRGKQKTEYLSYTTGRVLNRDDLGGEQRELLARILGMSVGDPQVNQWSARSQAEEPTESAQETALLRNVGEFELLSELGQGGMGKVYRAWQPSLGRQVALKCLLRAGDAKSEARFAREIQALGRIEHPNVVKIFTSGVEGDQWFYAMELVEGATLAAVCARLSGSTTRVTDMNVKSWHETLSTVCEESRQAEKLVGEAQTHPATRTTPPTRQPAISGLTTSSSYVRHVAELIRQAAEASHALHEAGVLHRDIKPGNIIVSADGTQAILMDLGLAQLADDVDGRLTRTRQFVGTLRYASPEQVMAAGNLDRRSDVYSLGATLWELLTLRPIYQAGEQTPTPQLMQSIQYDEPERPRKHNPGVGRDLEAIVLKCLEKQPSRRYDTARQLAEDLRRYLSSEPVEARPAGSWDRMKKWARRRPAVAALSATSILLAVLTFGLVTWKWQEAEAAQGRAESARLAETDARHKAEAAQQAEAVALKNEGEQHQKAIVALQQARTSLYFTCLALAEQEWSANNAGKVEELLDACPSELRGWEWHYFKKRCHADRLTFRASGAPLNCVRFSPDGKRVATASGDLFKPNEAGEVRVWDPSTGEGLLTLKAPAGQEHKGPVTSVAFSPDGQLLASASARMNWQEILVGNLKSAHSPDGEVKIWDANTGNELHTLTGYGTMAFRSDSRHLAYSDMDGTVKVWDVKEQKIDLILKTPPGAIECIAYSGDGKRLATASIESFKAPSGAITVKSTVKVWNAESGMEIFARSSEKMQISQVVFSPDGNRLALSGDENLATLWDAVTGKELLPLRGHTGRVQDVVFSPDGKQVATASKDQAVKVWDATNGQELFTLRGHASPVQSLAYDPSSPPDGPRLVTAGKDGLIKVWSAKPGQGALLLEGHKGFVRHVVFSPDGCRVATSGSDLSIKVWDLATSEACFTIDWNGEKVVLSPDGKRIAATGGSPILPDSPGQVKVWSAADGSELLTLSGHTMFVTSVAFSPDGKHLASGSGNPREDKGGEVIIWDAVTGRPERSFVPPIGCITSVAYGPEGKSLAVGGLDRKFLLCDPATGKEIRSWTGPAGSGLTLVFSPDGRRVAAGGEGTAAIWDAATGRALLLLEGHPGAIYGLNFSPDGGRLAATGLDIRTGKSEVTIWETSLGKKVISLPGQITVAFSPDGRRLASSVDGNILTTKALRVWDATPRPDVLTLRGAADIVYGVAVSPDGRLVASGHSGLEQKVIKIWERATGREIRTLWGHAGAVFHLSFSPDSQQLASASADETAKIWDMASGLELHSLRGHKGWVRGVAFSPDGRQIATAGYDMTVKLWDAATGQETGTLKGHTSACFDVAYRPDGKCLASASRDHSIRIWDPATGELVRLLTGHTAPVSGIAYSPDGKHLASASGDKTVRLWNADTGTELHTCTGHLGTVFGIAFGPDGRQVVSASGDQTLKSWDASTGQVIHTFRGHTANVFGVAYGPEGKFFVSSSFDHTVKVWDPALVEDKRGLAPAEPAK